MGKDYIIGTSAHDTFFKEFLEISISECLITSKERKENGLRMKQIFDRKIFMI